MSRGDDDSEVTRRKQIYFEELLQTVPWKTIARGFSQYQKRLLYLHAVESFNYEEIAERVNKDVEAVEYELKRIYATIRKRLKAINGKKGFFRSDI